MAVMRSMQQPPATTSAIVNAGGAGVPNIPSALPNRPPGYGQSPIPPAPAQPPAAAVAVAKAIVQQAASSGRPSLPAPAPNPPASRPNIPAVPVNHFPNTAATMNGPVNANPLRPNTNMGVAGAQPNVPATPGTPSPMRNWYNGNSPVQQPSLPLQQQQQQQNLPSTIASPQRPPVSVRTSRTNGQLQEQMARILNALKNNQGQQTAECLQMMRENPQLMAVFLRMRQQQQQQQQEAERHAQQQAQQQAQHQQVQQQKQQQQQQLQQMMQNQPVSHSQAMMQQQWPRRVRMAQQQYQQQHQQQQQQQQQHQNLQTMSNLQGLQQTVQGMQNLNGMQNLQTMSNMNISMSNLSSQNLQGLQQNMANIQNLQNVQNMVGGNSLQSMPQPTQQQQPQQTMFNQIQQPSPFSSNQRRLALGQQELQFNSVNMMQHSAPGGQLLQQQQQQPPSQHFSGKQILQQRLMSPQNTPISPQQAGTLLPNQSPRSLISSSPQPHQQPSPSSRQPTMSPSPRQPVMSPHTQPSLTSPHTIASPHPSAGQIDTTELTDHGFGPQPTRRMPPLPPLTSPTEVDPDVDAPLTPSDQLTKFVENL